MYIFISHSSKDARIAKDLCTVLETNGTSCFLAPRDIRPGHEYATEIVDGIDRSNALLLLLSNNATSSPHILREVERAVSKSIPIIVYKLEDVVLSKSFEYFLMSHQWLDAECCRYDILLKCIKDMDQQSADDSSATKTAVVHPQPENKKNKLLIPCIIGAALVVLLSIGLIISLGKKPDKNSDSTSNSSNTSSSQSNPISTVKLGDTVVFGKYNSADIEWKVLKISEDGTEAILISKNILTFKGFDCAADGRPNYSNMSADFQTQADSLGENSWANSTIRTWLNSDKDYVQYEGQAPNSLSMSDGCNGYELEAGFLYNFSSEELTTIKDTTIKTAGNPLAGSDTVTTTDKVFLLSLDELVWFEEAGVSLLAVPTPEAIANNESTFYKEYCQEVFHVDSCLWWLRDPLENSATYGYQVSHGAKPEEKTYTAIACVDGYGIRPAITVDLTTGIIKVSK